MSQKMHAVVFTGKGHVTFQSLERRSCSPDEILVKTHYSLISSGTELRVLEGFYGADKNFPLIPGYSIVGEVVSVGEKVHDYRVGDFVTGRNPPVSAAIGVTAYWGGQAGYQIYPVIGDTRPIVLPRNIDPLDYVIAEIASISHHGFEAVSAKPGESAIVIGQGLIGAFSAALLAAAGCRVIALDVEEGRLERAVKWGVAAVVNSKEPHAVERLKNLTNGGADIVVESSGTTPGIHLAHQLVRKTPRYVEPLGMHARHWPRLIMQASYIEPVQIDPAKFFCGEGLLIITPDDRTVEDRQKVVELIRRGVLKANDFVGKIMTPDQAPAAYKALREDKNNHFSIVFDWRSV